jgi:hypothetical protein
LDTLRHVRAEQARLYREARKNEGRNPDALTALRLSMILGSLRQVIELEDLERRVTALEKGEHLRAPSRGPETAIDLRERLSGRLLGHS